MIHYHGTPIGGKEHDASVFLNGRHALVPFGNHRMAGIVSEVCQSFILDNGAFSAWKSGQPITDWRPYYDFVDQWRCHPGFDWAIIPDIIGGSEEDNDALLAEWPFQDIGVPVWHLHESFDRLHRLANSYQRIALGSSAQYSNTQQLIWHWRIRDTFNVLCNENGHPKTKLHGLRMLNPAIFTKLPLASADSANVAMHGSEKAKRLNCSRLTAQIIHANQIESQQSAPAWIPTDSLWN